MYVRRNEQRDGVLQIRVVALENHRGELGRCEYDRLWQVLNANCKSEGRTL